MCGWTGSPTTVRSLLLGALSPSGELVYLGDVGTGFTQRQRREAAVMLTGIASADHPFTAGTTPNRTGSAHLRWVTPILVGTIEYREFHRRVRHPFVEGLPHRQDPRQGGVARTRRLVMSHNRFAPRRSATEGPAVFVEMRGQGHPDHWIVGVW